MRASDGADVIRLTHRSGAYPSYSPDGSQIVFEGVQGPRGACAPPFPCPDRRREGHLDGSLLVMNADGTGLHPIASHMALLHLSPSWSPDGRLILFSGWRGMYVVHPDGTGLRRITLAAPGLREAIYPSWSPDGTRFVFVARSGSDLGPTSSRRGRMAPMSSRSPTRATSTTAIQIGERMPVEKQLEGGSSARFGGVSMKSATRSSLGVTCAVGSAADGLRCLYFQLFSSRRNHCSFKRFPAPREPPWRGRRCDARTLRRPNRVHVEHRPGRKVGSVHDAPRRHGVKRLTILPDPNWPFSAPDWSPDGTQLVFTSRSPSSRHEQVYRINADGSGLTQLTHGTGIYNDNASWSPDGSKIVLTRARSGEYAIWVMNADGSGLRRLTGELNDNSHPTFTPDGKHILYASATGRTRLGDLDHERRRFEQAPAHPGRA